MLTKNKIKFIRSLASKKERYSHRLFIIEGEKLIGEALKSGIVMEEIIALESFENNFKSNLFSSASKKEMERISLMKKAPGILAVAKFMDWGKLKLDKGKYIVLDRINDPGNLGTIIRIADWFGINGIICSNDSVDVYNEKVVQSSMGSIFRIPVYYEELSLVLKNCRLTKMAAAMQGDDFLNVDFPESGLLLMGSESHGISEELLPFIDHHITISRIGKAESLNVGVAAGILCQAFTQK
jgi:TrmH family RNA methyltransferase